LLGGGACEEIDVTLGVVEGGQDGGANKGHHGFHIPAGIMVRCEGRQTLCQLALHMSQRSIFSSSKGLLETWHCGPQVLATVGIAGGWRDVGEGEGQCRATVGIGGGWYRCGRGRGLCFSFVGA